jgi:hypothetical protein
MLDITRGGREIQARPGSMLAANYIGHVADDHHVPGAEMSHRIEHSSRRLALHQMFLW